MKGGPGSSGRPFEVGMTRNDRDSELRKENRQLRQALDDCRELLKRTEQLLSQAQRTGGPKNDPSG